MVQLLSGPNAISALQLSRETGLKQQTLSKWLNDARRLPDVPREPPRPKRTIEDKARIVAEAGKVDGDALTEFLEREDVKFSELEQWRQALGEEGRASRDTLLQVKRLQQEIARKDRALAEAAALLVLRKKVQALWVDEDDDTDEEKE